jgi:hippurate hydrolase
VVSVTQFRAGDTWNAIPDVCTLRGTTRSFDPQVGDLLEKRVSELSKTIAAAYGCQAKVRYERRFPATLNDPTAAAVVRKAATQPPLGLSVANVPPSTGSEDFSFLLQQVPGCYLLLGSGRSSQNAPLHSPQFDFNDEALPLGAQLWVEIVRHSLGAVGGG